MILRRKTAKGKTRYGVRIEHDSKQIWVGTFATLAEARTAEANARTRPAQTKMTADEYADHFLEGYAQRNKLSSYDTAEAALSGFKADWTGVPLSRITRVQAEKWARKNAWRVPVIVTMLNAAVEAELLARNPFKGLSQKGPGRRRQQPLSPDEVDRLASIAARLHGPTMGSFITFAAYSALRVGEMFGLEWQDIDFEANRITVARRVYRGTLDLPKSNVTRTVSLTPPARDALLPLDRSTAWVFPNKKGRRMSQSSLSYAFQGITAAFGRHVTPHQLKHFTGYYLHVVLGLHERIVAEQLGHNDGGKLVRELYGHGDVGALEEIDRAFDNVLPFKKVQER